MALSLAAVENPSAATSSPLACFCTDYPPADASRLVSLHQHVPGHGTGPRPGTGGAAGPQPLLGLLARIAPLLGLLARIALGLLVRIALGLLVRIALGLLVRGAKPRERRAAGVDRRVIEDLLDAQQLVVLGDAVRAGRGAGLDLAAVGGDGQVGDGDVLRLSGAVR